VLEGARDGKSVAELMSEGPPPALRATGDGGLPELINAR